MSDFDVKEKRFEQDIEDYLIHFGGYTKGDPVTFNRASGLDEGTFIEFVKTSQPKQWERFVKIYDTAAEKQLIDRFSREVKQTSLLNVLRHGFTDRGIKFRAVFWKPEISGDTGHREPSKDPLTAIIDKINEKYGTNFTEMDKVLVQFESILKGYYDQPYNAIAKKEI